MFNDVITQQPNFTSKVLRCLVDGSRTVTEVSEMLRLEKGGRVSDALNRLAEAGMVSVDAGKNPETGKDVREQRFRLKDNYARFYVKYTEPVKKMIDDRRYSFKTLETLDNWDSVMGLQFENMVVNNYGSLISYLHLSDVLLTSAAPYRKSPCAVQAAGGVPDRLADTIEAGCICGGGEAQERNWSRGDSRSR